MHVWALKKENKYWDGCVLECGCHFGHLIDARLFRTKKEVKYWLECIQSHDEAKKLRNVQPVKLEMKEK